MSGEGVDVVFERCEAFVEEAARFGQRLGIEAHAVALHAGQYGHERHLHVGEEWQQAVLLQLAEQGGVQLQGDVGVPSVR